MAKNTKKEKATKAIKEVVEELKDEGMDVEVVSEPAKKEVKKEASEKVVRI